jgi:hypothetical protein
MLLRAPTAFSRVAANDLELSKVRLGPVVAQRSLLDGLGLDIDELGVKLYYALAVETILNVNGLGNRITTFEKRLTARE